MDFLLLNQGSKPALGLVECEGQTHRVPDGVEQLLSYVARFNKAWGDGRKIFHVSIRDALESPKQRSTKANAKYGSVSGWLSQARARVRSEKELVDVLSAASQHLVPILIYYRARPLNDDEQRELSFAFRQHNLYAGTVDPRTWKSVGSYV